LDKKKDWKGAAIAFILTGGMIGAAVVLGFLAGIFGI